MTEPKVQNQQTERQDVPVPDQNESRSRRKRGSSDFGPLDGYDFHVTGNARQIAMKSVKHGIGELNRDLTFYRIYVSVLREGQKVFDFEHTDMEKIGYTFTALSECVYQVAWGDESRVITCKVENEDRSTKVESPLGKIASL